MELIDLAQDNDTCVAFVNALMNFIFHKLRGVS
jgi:hypothetical protein